MLFQHGWTVQEIWRSPPAEQHIRERAAWVVDQVDGAVDAESASTVLLLGKSLGTFATGVAAQRGLAAIWLTPLLTDPDVVAALTAATAATLLVGGAADPLWDSAVARGLGLPFLELAEADHGLEIAGDAVRSAQLLTQVTGRIDAFLTELDERRS